MMLPLAFVKNCVAINLIHLRWGRCAVSIRPSLFFLDKKGKVKAYDDLVASYKRYRDHQPPVPIQRVASPPYDRSLKAKERSFRKKLPLPFCACNHKSPQFIAVATLQEIEPPRKVLSCFRPLFARMAGGSPLSKNRAIET